MNTNKVPLLWKNMGSAFKQWCRSNRRMVLIIAAACSGCAFIANPAALVLGAAAAALLAGVYL